MQLAHNAFIFSATDLSKYLACNHLTLLDRLTALGGAKPPKYPDPAWKSSAKEASSTSKAIWKISVPRVSAWRNCPSSIGNSLVSRS